MRAARPALEERARAAGVADSIRWAGFQSSEGLVDLYRGAIAYVDPSLYEGFGLQAAEALACGTPVIASNTTSLPEVVGDAGILLDPHDVAGFAAAMRRVAEDGAARRRPAGRRRSPGPAASPGSTRPASSSPRARRPCDELARSMRSGSRCARPPRPGARVRPLARAVAPAGADRGRAEPAGLRPGQRRRAAGRRDAGLAPAPARVRRQSQPRGGGPAGRARARACWRTTTSSSSRRACRGCSLCSTPTRAQGSSAQVERGGGRADLVRAVPDGRGDRRGRGRPARAAVARLRAAQSRSRDRLAAPDCGFPSRRRPSVVRSRSVERCARSSTRTSSSTGRRPTSPTG